MNKLHVLPTDKPSRLYINSRYKHYEFCEIPRISTQHKKCYNIYITSDEYIGLSYYLDGNLVRKGVVDDRDYWGVRKDYKKIILTTDQDLIKDGVQSIDDEFLEWFVKNPSCETVEVEKWFDTSHIDLGIGKVYHNNPTIPLYKIIIPKEEPKQTVEEYEQQGLEKYSYELKQETLEEAIERLYGDGTDCKGDIIKSAIRVGRIDAFYDATKWQQERSEEEIIWALLLCSNKKFKNSLEVKEWWNNFNSK